MKHLKAFLASFLVEKEDLSKLPEDMMREIKKVIRKGAENLDQRWSNALELVHYAYNETGVQRPTPNMASAWTQYEENIRYAVEQLAKTRGLDGDWRMSASIFHENESLPTFFDVVVTTPFAEENYSVQAKSVEEIVTDIANLLKDDPKTQECLIKVEKFNKGGRKITFWLHNTKKNCEIVVIPNYSGL